jgi:ATP-binding cassette, subfamily B, bacterial
VSVRSPSQDLTPRQPLQRLLAYGRNYRKLLWSATICSILNKLFDLAPPALIGIAVDVVVKQQDSIIARYGVRDVYGQFIVLSILTVIVWVLESVFEYAFARLWRNLAQNIQHDLRLDAYKHLQELELAYFEERSTGGLMSIWLLEWLGWQCYPCHLSCGGRSPFSAV